MLGSRIMRQMADRLHGMERKQAWPHAHVVYRDERNARDHWGQTDKEQEWARHHEEMQSQGCSRHHEGRDSFAAATRPSLKGQPVSMSLRRSWGRDM